MGGCLPRDYGCAAVTHVRQNRIRAIRLRSLNCSVATSRRSRLNMAVKIKLTRLGKIRNPQYRIAVADARTRRDGRSIEVIGRYHPKEEPSLIEIDSERAQYWLGVGAQPTEPVLQLLKITGDWQKFKGLPGAEGTLKVKEPKPSKLDLFNAALAEADGAPSGEATQPKKKKAPAKKAAEKAEAPAETATAEPATAETATAEAAEAPAETTEAPAEAPEAAESAESSES
jgi:small subunit ribosomal protein S16